VLYCFLHSERVFCVHSSSDGSELDNGIHGPPLGSMELLSLIAIVNTSLVQKGEVGKKERREGEERNRKFQDTHLLVLTRLKPMLCYCCVCYIVNTLTE
jgi:hypothetical protein